MTCPGMMQAPLAASSQPGPGTDSEFHAFCKNGRRASGCALQGLIPPPHTHPANEAQRLVGEVITPREEGGLTQY